MKKEDNYNVIYANSLSELQVKAIGCHHDRCNHYYFGHISKLPDKYNYLIDAMKVKQYIFIYN